MSIYNLLQSRLRCPRCQNIVNVTINVYTGFRDLIKYQIGDKYLWIDGKAPQNGGPPDEGNMDGEGYVGECPVCQKDFFVKVIIRANIIQSAQPDLTKEAYIQ